MDFDLSTNWFALFTTCQLANKAPRGFFNCLGFIFTE